jgi:hypothetical protein
MGLKLRRRAVYFGTIVALVAMVGGLAVAAISGIVFTTGTGNQNFGSITSGNTIYAAATVTLTLVSGDGLGSGCSTSTSYSANAASIAVVGTGSACPATGEWYDELTFSGVGSSGAVSDTFFVAVNGGNAGGAFVVTSSGTISSATLSIFVDDGPTTGAPAITSLSVTVTGS